MKKINVSAFSQADLKDLVTNAKVVFNDELGANLGLNQVRNHVSHLFGAKGWKSLEAAADQKGKASSATAPVVYVGFRAVKGNGWDPETNFFETFVGLNEEDCYTQMLVDFCQDNVDELIGEEQFEEDENIEQGLRNLGISDERIKELACQIRAIDPEDRDLLGHLFTSAELVGAYAQMWSDEERIWVEPYELPAKPSSNTQKPDNVQVIHYDLKAGMAITLLEGALVGFYQRDSQSASTPFNYEWDNGFDFEFITPDQANAISRAGFTQVVKEFEARGTIVDEG